MSPADATCKRVYCRLRKRVTDLLGGRAPRTANLASFYRQKPHYQHITYGLQSDWLQHHPYQIGTRVIRGRQMFVLTRSRKNHKLFCNSYGKSCKLFVQFSETEHRLLRHQTSLPCKFPTGRDWGGGVSLSFFILKSLRGVVCAVLSLLGV